MFILKKIISDKKLYNIIKFLYRAISKTKLKSILVNNQKVVYLEANPKSENVIVLLHGITADKYIWPYFARRFAKKGYRVIIPDLPPFGESQYDENIDYSVEYQAKNLRDILKAIKLEGDFHLAGNSMGGGVAAKLAILHPELIKSLILIDNMGIYTAKRTEFLNNIESGGKNFLLIQNKEDLQKMLNLVYYKIPYIPKAVARELIREGRLNYDLNKKVFDDLIKEEWYMDNDLDKIKVPTFILWGSDDKVFDISSVKILEEGIKGSSSDIINKSGHLPINEHGDISSEKVMNFIENLK